MGRPSPVPLALMAGLALVLVVVAVAVGASAGAPRRAAGGVDVARIARRVEVIRRERFTRPVAPRIVTPAQARQDGIGDIDQSYPPARRRADEETLELLGLLPPGADLKRLESAIFSEQVAGYYDPRSKRLSVVSGSGSGNAVLDQIVLSHELTHALEDQHFGLAREAGGTDDAATARTALEEGSATEVMVRYAARYIGPGPALTGALGALGRQAEATRLPRYLQDSLEFPYDGGLRFVQALIAHGGWAAVDRADTTRPPASTEQIMHPGAYVAREGPRRVTLPRARALGPGWTRRAAGTLGEWDTRELLLVGHVGAHDAGVAAAGWGGGRYALWQRGGGAAACPAPCRARDVLIVRWRWDTPADAHEFSDVLLVWLARGGHATPAGSGRWRIGGGSVHVRASRQATTLVMAPTAAQAAALAR